MQIGGRIVVRNMGWATPRHKRSDVDAAGDLLIAPSPNPPELGQALLIINNWRASHSYPLNTFQMWLRKNARRADKRSLVVQRIKRLPSIDLKLRRFGWLKLSEVQDIGGCRAVVGSVRSVDRLVARYKSSRLKHKLENEDDYIRSPKKSGYRGVHLIYRYYGRKKPAYAGLKVEVQLRSSLQHAWATAVETVGTFTRQALKSSLGEREWLRFFALMGSALAMREGTPLVPGTPTDQEALRAEIREHAKRLDVQQKLEAYRSLVEHSEDLRNVQGAHYFLLALDAEARTLIVTGFQASESQQASKAYLKVERATAGKLGADAVLVSAESVAALKRAYPNYFLDTRVFLEALKQAITEPTPTGLVAPSADSPASNLPS